MRIAWQPHAVDGPAVDAAADEAAVAAEPARPSGGLDVAAARPDLALRRSGLRFCDESEERRYRDWYREESRTVARTAFAGGIGMWLGGILAVALIFDDGLRRGLLLCVSMMAYNVVGLVASRSTRYRGALIGYTASTNVLAGLALALIGVLFLEGRGELTALTGVMVIIIFFGFIQLRLRPVLAAVSVAASQTVFLVMLFAVSDGELGTPTERGVAVGSIVLAYLGGLFMCVLIERQLRTRFADERTIEWQSTVIHHERQRADGLLAQMLPAPIIERLKHEPGVIAEHHDEVSVLFADIVGFTPMSARLPATTLVDLLNHLFSAFDGLVHQLGLTKLHTIGDGYMVVSGLPVPRPDHANALVELGCRMLGFVVDDPGCREERVQLRVGINTGAVVAGVIGTTAFQYDVWGDTVNVAARMESHGVAGRVQVTTATHDQIAARYECEPRGPIEVKGKGALEAWLVVGPSAV